MKINNKYGFIYITTNNINNKRYIGKCEYNRKNGWKDYLGSGKVLKQAIKKYGVDNFTREIIHEADSLEELNMLEEYYIRYYNACDNDDFYNIATGGTGGNTRKGYTSEEYEEYCKKVLRLGEQNGMFGKTHTAESKRKNGDKTKERFKDVEFITKHSNAVKEAMKKIDKSKLAFENRSRNTKIICSICGKEEYVYTSQQKYCSECKSKYTSWQLKTISEK